MSVIARHVSTDMLFISQNKSVNYQLLIIASQLLMEDANSVMMVIRLMLISLVRLIVRSPIVMFVRMTSLAQPASLGSSWLLPMELYHVLRTSARLKIVILVMLKENVWPVSVVTRLSRTHVWWTATSKIVNNVHKLRTFAQSATTDMP